MDQIVTAPRIAKAAPGAPVIEVRNLSVDIGVPLGTLHALSDVSFSIRRGETLALVGESGCGKTMTSLAVMGLLPDNAVRRADHLALEGRDLQTASTADLAAIRGERVAMVFQDPLTALNPVYTIGDQLEEMYMYHGRGPRRLARERAEYMLGRVGISAPRDRMKQYPHQLSGGLRQRVVIAMALMLEPALIIADEPTTALDVTIQAQILTLLADLQKEFNTALLLITHDMGVVARMADRVAVMYAGRIVEEGTAAEVFARPRHPYTEALLSCIPSPSHRGELGSIPGIVPSLIGEHDGCMFRARCDYAMPACAVGEIAFREAEPGHAYRCIRAEDAVAERRARAGRHAFGGEPTSSVGWKDENVLQVRGLGRAFSSRRGILGKLRTMHAVEDVDLDLRRGEVLAVVGESGSGKTTLARMLLGLLPPTSGQILLDGEPIAKYGAGEIARRVQPVFQDPYSSLNPRKTIGQIIAAPLEVRGEASGKERQHRIREMMDLVGLPPFLLHSYPSQLSGGQRQRVAIARALVIRPDVVICDEPTSALDVSVQAQILNLLADLRRELGVTYIFISHDLSVVRHMADRAAVMYLGRVVEMGDIEQIFGAPRHPYTKALLASALTPDPALGLPEIRLGRGIPDPFHRPSGCYFHTRCPSAFDECSVTRPATLRDGDRLVECHLVAMEKTGEPVPA